MGTSSVAHDRSGPARRIANPVVDPMVGASPGWYYDPADEAIYRWFDGESWTEHRSDIFSSEPPVEGGTDQAN